MIKGTNDTKDWKGTWHQMVEWDHKGTTVINMILYPGEHVQNNMHRSPDPAISTQYYLNLVIKKIDLT